MNPKSPLGTKVGDFHFWIPVDEISKAGPMNDTEMRIGGVVTTDQKDFQGERVLPGALRWDYFKKRGWFNDGHDKTTAGGIGYPTKVIEDVDLGDGRKGARVEGVLLPTDRAKKIYELAKACEGSPRKLGFSVQGPIVKRRGPGNKEIVEAVVMDIAIDRHPVNPGTGLEVLAKSLYEAQKAIDAGHPVASNEGGGTAAALVPQSLRGSKSKKENETMKRSERLAMFKAMSDEDQDKLLKGHKEPDGDENEEDDEDEDEDDLEKGMSAAFGEVRDHMEKGGTILMVDPDEEGNLVEMMKGLSTGLSDFNASINNRLDVLSKAMMATGKLVQDLNLRIEDVEDGVSEKVDEMSKALHLPVARKTSLDGERVKRPEDQGTEDDFVMPSTAKDELRKSWSGCTDQNQKERIGRAMLLMDGGQRYTRKQLNTITGTK